MIFAGAIGSPYRDDDSGATSQYTLSGCTAGGFAIVVLAWRDAGPGTVAVSMTCPGEQVRALTGKIVGLGTDHMIFAIEKVKASGDKTFSLTLNGINDSISWQGVEFRSDRNALEFSGWWSEAARSGAYAAISPTDHCCAVVSLISYDNNDMDNFTPISPGPGAWSVLAMGNPWTNTAAAYSTNVGPAGAKTIDWNYSSGGNNANVSVAVKEVPLRRSRFITVREPWTTQPPYDAPIDWDNPITSGLLVAATPFSPHNGFVDPVGKLRASKAGMVVRGGMKLQKTLGVSAPCYEGFFNSSFVVVDAMMDADNGSFWQGGNFCYKDTATEYPNDSNTFAISSCNSYGMMNIWARNNNGDSVRDSIDVYPAGGFSPASGEILIRGGTIDTTGLLTGWGPDGKSHGTSTMFQTGPWGTPSAGKLPPFIGMGGNGAQDDVVSYQGLVLRWKRKLNDGEMHSIMLNPWQVFKPRERRIFTGAPVITHRRQRVI